MTVNVKKVAKDIFHDDEDVRILALTAVLQLTSSSVGGSDDLSVLIKSLEKAADKGDGDVVFLARKGLNHLRCLRDRLTKEKSAPKPAAAGGPPAEMNRERLLKVLENHETDMQLGWAISSLIKKGTAEDVPLVVPYLKHRDARVRSNSVEFLERHGSVDVLLEHCVPLLQDENNRVKGTVATVLGRIGHPTVADYLSKLLDDHRISVRESAVYALSNIRGDKFIELLVKALRDPYEGIRLRAVQGLGRQKDPRTLPHLKEALNDLDAAVCDEAERAIAFISLEEAAGFSEGHLDLGLKKDVAETSAKADKVPKPPMTELQKVGRELFKLQQAGTLSNEAIDKVCYEGMRIIEFLDRHRYRADEKAKEGGEGLLSTMRSDLGNPTNAERQAIKRLESKLATVFEEVGKIAMTLMNDNKLGLTGEDELLQRLDLLRKCIGR